ncbi:putative kinesin family protein [Rosellinia necatrix]|uniref:Kinesin-like protein n=1 Tax=Rosellinia necatrix TaxID=77044 RepID=A0A1S7UM96_ROSNE|nr:putative kinesin family protein [Rosellinia necatrix]
MSNNTSENKLGVYVRWRPLDESETTGGQIEQTSTAAGDTRPPFSISVNPQAPGNPRPWTSPPAFRAVLGPGDDNAHAYESIVAPAIPQILRGRSCNFFAYGHSGSGKTHTIIGYDYEEGSGKLGLCLAAGQRLFEALDSLNGSGGDGNGGDGDEDGERRLGLSFSLFELRKNTALDLLNGRTACHVREGPDGRTHIRGPTETLAGGRVRVQPLTQRACWTPGALREALAAGLGLRAVGSSSVHDQSSRTHAVLRLEVVDRRLVAARRDLADRESELVPAGKRATDVSIEEQMRALVKGPDGAWAPNPDYQVDQARIDEAEAEKARCEARVAAAEARVSAILSSSSSDDGTAGCLGGKMVFVDLAGAEYQAERGAQTPLMKAQTPQERQEGRQINTDLLALKEVIRAWSTGQPRIPFRLSPLTMVLREHFVGAGDGTSAMIVTVSPAKDQYPATLNSLKYGSLVGTASS